MRDRVMRDNDISQQVKTRTITVLYGFLTQRQEIPEYILKEYGLTEDYAMYNRIENMDHEIYDAGRKNGSLPDITALEARLTRKIEAAMESCGKPPVTYLEKLNEELDTLGIIARNPEYADRIFYKLDFFAKYGIDRTAPHRTQAGQAEKAYRELDSRFVRMTGRRPYADELFGPDRRQAGIAGNNRGRTLRNSPGGRKPGM